MPLPPGGLVPLASPLQAPAAPRPHALEAGVAGRGPKWALPYRRREATLCRPKTTALLPSSGYIASPRQRKVGAACSVRAATVGVGPAHRAPPTFISCRRFLECNSISFITSTPRIQISPPPPQASVVASARRDLCGRSMLPARAARGCSCSGFTLRSEPTILLFLATLAPSTLFTFQLSTLGNTGQTLCTYDGRRTGVVFHSM